MADFQDDFTAAVLDAAIPVPDGLICPDGRPAAKRFDVYRNNVIVSLTEALGVAFPVIKKLVGEAFFNAMAQIYVRANPPKSPLMMFYGDGFPDFLASFDRVQHLPYLPDVARLERARREVYHAADEPILSPEFLGSLDEATLLATHLTPIAAARIVTSGFPIASIWRFNMTDDTSPIPQRAEDVLIARPADIVEMHLLAPGSAVFIDALRNGTALGPSAEIAATTVAEFDLGVSLGDVFRTNIIKQTKEPEFGGLK